MTLPKWQRNGGRDFAFYHPHSGFEWEDLETTNKYQEMLCHDFQVGPAHASLARIRYGVIVLHRGSVYGCDRDRETLQAPQEWVMSTLRLSRRTAYGPACVRHGVSS